MPKTHEHLKVEERALIQAMLELNSQWLHHCRAAEADARRKLLLTGDCQVGLGLYG